MTFEITDAARNSGPDQTYQFVLSVSKHIQKVTEICHSVKSEKRELDRQDRAQLTFSLLHSRLMAA